MELSPEDLELNPESITSFAVELPLSHKSRIAERLALQWLWAGLEHANLDETIDGTFARTPCALVENYTDLHIQLAETYQQRLAGNSPLPLQQLQSEAALWAQSGADEGDPLFTSAYQVVCDALDEGLYVPSHRDFATVLWTDRYYCRLLPIEVVCDLADLLVAKLELSTISSFSSFWETLQYYRDDPFFKVLDYLDALPPALEQEYAKRPHLMSVLRLGIHALRLLVLGRPLEAEKELQKHFHWQAIATGYRSALSQYLS